jgi:hypothetical protein
VTDAGRGFLEKEKTPGNDNNQDMLDIIPPVSIENRANLFQMTAKPEKHNPYMVGMEMHDRQQRDTVNKQEREEGSLLNPMVPSLPIKCSCLENPGR